MQNLVFSKNIRTQFLIIWKHAADFTKESIFSTAYFAKECYFLLRSVYFTRIVSFGEVPEESHSAAACRNLLQSLPLWRTLRCALDLLSVGTTSTEPNFGAGGCSFGKSQGTPPNHTHRSRGGWLPAWQTQPNITAVSNSTAGASCSLPLPQDLAHCSDPAHKSKPGQTIYLQKKHFCHLSFARKKPPLTPHQAHSIPAANQD